jgi:tryptophanyl-tRNA synthetase
VEDLKKRYKEGKVGDVEVKERLYEALNAFLAPIREKRRYYEQNPQKIIEILGAGSVVARKEAIRTLGEVKEKMKLSTF